MGRNQSGNSQPCLAYYPKHTYLLKIFVQTGRHENCTKCGRLPYLEPLLVNQSLQRVDAVSGPQRTVGHVSMLLQE